ncbi:MAG: PASTA domain-containing protein [Ruminococcus sp.]|nr:PASTA domain-containing protein [Ruminococcus sp.]
MPNYTYNLCLGCMEPLESGGVCPLCGYAPGTPSLSSYLKPGVTLNDRYLIGKLLSYNGEGATYIGFDTVTSSKVTVKEYMPDTLCSRTDESGIISVRQNCVAQYKAFMSEFVELNKMLAKMRTLSHICPPIDMFGDNNTGYVVFRYIEGENLARYLKDHAGELTWEEVKRLFPPIFTTLSLVHNAGLVHRGISPENIIVTEKEELMLIGFSIADSRTANTELASEIFHGYAAPEQYSSSNWQGTWTDVYGICALLYRILTGTAPTDAMERVANDTLPEPGKLNPNIPANVSKVIMNGMTLSGEMRIQTVTELVTQLFEEPEFNKAKSQTATQTISIPKQHSTKGTVAPKKEEHKGRPSRSKMFWVVLVSAACVMMISMTALMMALDDNSDPIVDGITESTSLPDGGVTLMNGSLTDSSSSDSGTFTSPPEGAANAIPTLPTLAVEETVSPENSSVEQTTFKPKSTIYIMNDLVGKVFDTVKNTAINETLTIVPEYVYTDEYEKGIIFEQSIEKGSNYENGQEVILKISMGPAKVMIPDFYGLNKKDYFELLNSAGIKYEEKAYETDSTLNDYVAWISMEPGEYIDLEAGEVLSVHVAVNPDNTAPPETTITETSPTQTSPTAWVTTVPPTVPTETTTAATEPPPIIWTEPPLTDEPDIIISDDY